MSFRRRGPRIPGYLPFGGAAKNVAEVVQDTLAGNPSFDEVQWSTVSEVCAEIYTFDSIRFDWCLLLLPVRGQRGLVVCILLHMHAFPRHPPPVEEETLAFFHVDPTRKARGVFFVALCAAAAFREPGALSSPC